MSARLVLTFVTTHEALDAEAELLSCGFVVEPIPTPAVSGTRCGIAMQLAPSERDAALTCLRDSSIDVADVLVLDDD